jgi:hypothetical protein
MVVSPSSFFDDDLNSPLQLADSAENHAELDLITSSKKSSAWMWSFLAFFIVASASVSAGYYFGISANGNHREVFNHYTAYFGLDSVPVYDDLVVDNYNDTSVYALDYDRLENKNSLLEQQLEALGYEKRYLVMAKESLENILDGEILSFEDTDLGFSFEYPAEFGEVELVFDGDSYRGAFMNNPYLKFGAATMNYDQSSKINFLDYGRYDGKGFIGNAVLKKSFKVDGVTVSVYEGMDNYKGALMKGELGALLTYDGDKFSSLAILLTDKDEMVYEEFIEIISSLSFS